MALLPLRAESVYTPVKIEVVFSGERLPKATVVYTKGDQQIREALEFGKRYPASVDVHGSEPAEIAVKVFGSVIESTVILMPGRPLSLKKSNLLKGPVVTRLK